MPKLAWIALTLFVVCGPLCPGNRNCAHADEVRYFEEDGVTYQETRRVVRRPVVETYLEPRQQTVYRDKFDTTLKQTERKYMAPIVEYQWQPHWVNPINPFAQSYVAYRWVPVTRWVERTELVRIPETKHEVVPEQITVNVPVTRQRYAEDEYVSRVAIGVKPQGGSVASAPRGSEVAGPVSSPSVARREVVGGVRRLDSDPPRSGDWRPARRY